MAVYDQPFEFSDMGIVCPHAWAAVALGMDRLEKISRGTRYHTFLKASRKMAVENAKAAETVGTSPFGQLLTAMTGGQMPGGEGSIADILKRLPDDPDDGPDYSGTEAQVGAEFANTDPLVKIYVLVGLQRGMFYQMASTRTLEEAGFLTGVTPPFTPLEKQYEAFSRLSDLVFEVSDAVLDRGDTLHTEDADGKQILNEWPYPPLPGERGATTPRPSPEAVKLSDEEKSRSDGILGQIFGGGLFPNG